MENNKNNKSSEVGSLSNGMNPQEAEKKLQQTQADLEKELKDLGEVPEMGSDVDAFDTETDEAEEYSKNLGIKDSLKGRLQAVKDALAKIQSGTYGKCEKCGMQIPEEILEVNPEARFCSHCNK
ncbi:MAG: TraR/DksA family transcriptional regulator [Patescibacteria group bacterium]